MAHGYSAVKEMYLDSFAEVFVTLVFLLWFMTIEIWVIAMVNPGGRLIPGARLTITAMLSPSPVRFQKLTKTELAYGDQVTAADMSLLSLLWIEGSNVWFAKCP